MIMVFGIMDDNDDFELNAYQPKVSSLGPHWIGKRPFVKQPKLADALQALVENKNQMIQEATMIPGDFRNFPTCWCWMD